MQCKSSIYISRGKHNTDDVNIVWRRIFFFLSFFLSIFQTEERYGAYLEIQTATKNKREIYIYIYTEQIHIVDMYIN